MPRRSQVNRWQMDANNARARERRRKAREARPAAPIDKQHYRNCDMIVALLLSGATLEDWT